MIMLPTPTFHVDLVFVCNVFLPKASLFRVIVVGVCESTREFNFILVIICVIYDKHVAIRV